MRPHHAEERDGKAVTHLEAWAKAVRMCRPDHPSPSKMSFASLIFAAR